MRRSSTRSGNKTPMPALFLNILIQLRKVLSVFSEVFDNEHFVGVVSVTQYLVDNRLSYSFREVGVFYRFDAEILASAGTHHQLPCKRLICDHPRGKQVKQLLDDQDDVEHPACHRRCEPPPLTRT